MREVPVGTIYPASVRETFHRERTGHGFVGGVPCRHDFSLDLQVKHLVESRLGMRVWEEFPEGTISAWICKSRNISARMSKGNIE